MTPERPAGPGHEGWEQLAVGHALDALEPADEEAFAGHLPSCASCRRLVAEMQNVAAGLAYAADPTEPPASLWRGIADAVTASDRPPLPPAAGSGPPAPAAATGAGLIGQPDGGPPAGATPRRRAGDLPGTAMPARAESPTPGRAGRRPAWLRSSALAVAAALVVLVGLSAVVLVGRFLQVRSDKAAAQRQLSAVLSCAGRPACVVVPLKPQAGSSASAVALVQDGGVDLVVNDLPATDRTSSYVLWAQGAGGVTGVGRFVVSNPGRHIISPDLKSEVALAAGGGLAVTREPGRAVPARPSTPVILEGRAA